MPSRFMWRKRALIDFPTVPIAAGIAEPQGWWSAGGASGAVLAYQAKGAASYAAAKVNQVQSGTYNLTELTAAPAWDTTNGMQHNSECFDTGWIPTGGSTLIARYSNASGNSTLVGTYDNTYLLYLQLFLDFNAIFYGNGGGSLLGSSAPASAIVAVSDMGYLNGSNIGAGSLTPHAVGASLYVGALNNAGSPASFYNGYWQAIAAYNAILTPSQIAAVTTAMAAL